MRTIIRIIKSKKLVYKFLRLFDPDTVSSFNGSLAGHAGDFFVYGFKTSKAGIFRKFIKYGKEQFFFGMSEQIGGNAS